MHICTRIDTRIDGCSSLFFFFFFKNIWPGLSPNGFELVEDPVPTAQHWLTLTARPADFDANSVWIYVQKLREIEWGKQFSTCAFCLKKFAGHHATKMVQHPSGLCCSEISTCLGVLVFPTAAPLFVRDSCKAAVVKKANDLASKKKIFANNYYYHLKNNLFVCLKKVDK